ncbi:myosin-binding striated muscle assembly central-domain-containing protein [Pyronema domesticum]|uniref:Similar to Ring assembly protein 3 acc. no. O74994 n=1 Tax=Pyronema omphalodes (strain CBS 100304) TaxID=1076935 RepID=U4KUW8_PYROM|nr:myosin-binding striated muscle assembly central-domain-containing protein [Pyronema domesticum]CCX04897.1 Similar to Ring assembly protein 3; acc. no. O74994 [Pyronema omphalodes CBS 100304]
MNPEELRAASLATQALEHFQADRKDDAVRALREALSLAPRNPVVLSTFQVFQEDANTPPIEKLITKFAVEKDEAAGNEAHRLLKDPNVSLRTDTAVQCMQLLESRVDELSKSIAGKLVGEMLKISKGAREYLAEKIVDGYSAVLELYQKLGEEAVDAVVTTLLEPAAFKNNGENQNKACRECFKWFLARLKPEDNARAIARSVSRLLSAKGEELHSFVNQAGLEHLLALLDSNSPIDLRSHATLAIAKFAETSGETGQNMIGNFMMYKLAADTDADLRLVFSVAAAIFPLIPEIAGQLFLTEGFVENLVSTLQARPEDVEHAALEMLSAACVEKTCRTAIAEHCTTYLEALVKSGDAGKSTAAVVLAKVKYTPGETKEADPQEIDKLGQVFKAMMITGDAEARDTSVEGLAYTSLKGTVKEKLAKDKNFVKNLVETLKNSTGKPTVMFGALTVVANLTAYPPVLSEEQKKVAQLKNYAETKPNAKIEPDREDKEEKVTPRCKILIDAGIVSALVACSKKTTPNTTARIADILLSLSKDQKHRGMIASGGGVKLALQCNSSQSGSETQDKIIQLTSAHAAARILISVNPNHVFSSQLTISSAIRPLYSLLEDNNEVEKNLLAVFEGLLALTNLASTEDSIRDQIIRIAWTRIEDLLLHDNTMIQRATVELICNLMACPQGVAKFADGSAAADNRMHILLALADAEDFATRRAAGGALAMLTEWDKACEAVVKRKRGIRICLDMVAEDNEEIRHRGVVVVRNLVCGQGQYGPQVKQEGGIEVLRVALKETRQPEALHLGVEALKSMMEVV